MNNSLINNITLGLERVSEVFKSLLWEKAKNYGISPLQIQLLLFVISHKPELCMVSNLAKEFNISKATVSDAIKVLDAKGFIQKTPSTSDSRSYTIAATNSGHALILELSDYSKPFQNELTSLDETRLTDLYSTLTDLIYKLNRSGLLQVQRTCFGCRFYEKKPAKHYCHLLEQPLHSVDIRIDCPDYIEKV